MMVAEDIRGMLIERATRDLEVRERLRAEGSLFDGYHPEMQAVHEDNAAALDDIIQAHGWPTAELAGADGAEAAWLIVQHAIGLPEFQRRCLERLQEAAATGAIPAWQPAMLLDRIRILEGKPQVYGTQFDWNAEGEMEAFPIEDAARIEERRAAVGLPSFTDTKQAMQSQPKPPNPADRAARRDEWAKKVGWR
jgi:hypothetical protein